MISGLASFLKSLRARFALGVALPLFLVLISLSIFQYQRDLQRLETQARLSAIQLGEIMVKGLNHAMLHKDGDDAHLIDMLNDVGAMENVTQVQIIGLSGKVLADSNGNPAGTSMDITNAGCQVCHQSSDETRPRVAELRNRTNVLRISTPVDNPVECHGCHAPEISHLGVLLTDISLAGIQSQLLQDLRLDFGVSAGSTFLVTVGIYFMIHWLVVRRVDTFRSPVTAFAAGDFSVRIPKTSPVDDEICELGDTFNLMLDELERHQQEREERSKVREQAILDERERIARELHDGLAQVLGYVNTKVMAVRLMLQKGRLDAADSYLIQLEEAARGSSTEVREAILGLRMTSQVGSGLAAALRAYSEQFARLSDLYINFDSCESCDELSLPPETELQLFRIAQEAITNVRKHASASQVWMTLEKNNGTLSLQVRDNGRGFNVPDTQRDQCEQLGLSTMRERADQIGANLSVKSGSGIGTYVQVKLDLMDGKR